MKAVIIIFAIIILSKGFAQGDTLMLHREHQLFSYLNDLRAAEKDADKSAKNKIFKDYLKETIQMPGAFEYPFSSLKSIGTIKSEDNIVRLFNWNVEQDDKSQNYFCYILKKDAKNNIKVSELIDNSFALSARPQEVLDAENWYGALYYKIIPITKGSKQLYTLLGYDANNTMSNVKLIDVLTFNGNNPKLGAPIFKIGKETFNRMFYEHSEKAYMSLKYEKEFNRIIFDHLSPETPSMVGFYSYYVPDLSYDAFKLVKDKWILQEDVVGINKKSDEKIVVHVQNPRTGKLEEKEFKGKWVDPTDGSTRHVATLPEEAEEEAIATAKKTTAANTKTTSTEEIKTNKTHTQKSERIYSSYVYVGDVKKKRKKRK